MSKVNKNTNPNTDNPAVNGHSQNGSFHVESRLSVLKTYKLYIGGKFPRTESGRFYQVRNADGKLLANLCRGSRKDFRMSVVAARKAQGAWAGRTHFNRGQIIYRIAEMLEGRQAQFIAELVEIGHSTESATAEVHATIDRLIYYAGWADKYQQIFSSVNTVSSSHFNFTVPEPTGVVAAFAPQGSPLLGLVSTIIPIIVGGNTCIVLAGEEQGACAISFAEVLNSSDVPGGVVNILTGHRHELAGHFSTHMDVNAMVVYGAEQEMKKTIQQNATKNVKRSFFYDDSDLFHEEAQSPYFILDTQELKTTWHPVGGSFNVQGRY